MGGGAITGNRRELNTRWMIGREKSSSSSRVFSSMSSSESSAESLARGSRSSLKSTKPMPAGRAESEGPFFRLPFRLSDTAPVPAALVNATAPPSDFFLLNRKGTDCVAS